MLGIAFGGRTVRVGNRAFHEALVTNVAALRRSSRVGPNLGCELLGKSHVLGAARRWVPLTPDSSVGKVRDLAGPIALVERYRTG